MSRKLVCRVSLAAVFVLSVVSADASIIYESATNPQPSMGGWGLSNNEFLGTRFSVANTTQITAIGGHLGSAGTYGIFGAVVKLSGPTGLPRLGGDILNSNPFDSNDVVTHAVFIAPRPSADVRISVNATLTPGWYGLVFGSYLWGAGAYGYMPGSEDGGSIDLPGASYFRFYDGSWEDHSTDPYFTPSGLRFVVEGTPEPASAILLLVGGLLAARADKRGMFNL
jgi:hypothetical protein